jgi:hypothetical protein
MREKVANIRAAKIHAVQCGGSPVFSEHSVTYIDDKALVTKLYRTWCWVSQNVNTFHCKCS